MNDLAIPADLSADVPRVVAWANALSITTPVAFADAAERSEACKEFPDEVPEMEVASRGREYHRAGPCTAVPGAKERTHER